MRRKPLPYAAVQLIDAALMANTDAVRALMPVVRGEGLSREELYRRLAEAIHCIHESTDALREARAANANGKTE